MPSINQLPAAVQPVSGADLLVLSQTETGGSTPGAVATVRAPLSAVLSLVPNQSASATIAELQAQLASISAQLAALAGKS
jgi:hypothetical protein